MSGAQRALCLHFESLEWDRCRCKRITRVRFAGIAEFERALIATRTEEGRRAAQARGVSFGRPPKLRPDQRTPEPVNDIETPAVSIY